MWSSLDALVPLPAAAVPNPCGVLVERDAVAPVAPVLPVEPVGPGTVLAAPVLPVAPVLPIAPVAPVAPMLPVEPVGPVAHVDPEPVAPVAPVTPIPEVWLQRIESVPMRKEPSELEPVLYWIQDVAAPAVPVRTYT